MTDAPVGFGLGRVPDPPDERDWLVRQVAPRLMAARVPVAVDLRGRLGPVLNQGQTSECVAHAAAVIKTFQERRDHRKTYAFDPHRLYRECKARDGIPNQDGTFIRTACDLMQSVGAGRRDRPWERDAPAFRLAAYARLLSVEEVRAAIATIGPVEVGVEWFNEWFQPAGHVLSTPRNPGASAGGHAICLCGYSERPFAVRVAGQMITLPGQMFVMRNSWGPNWADAGHAYLPYSELARQLSLPGWQACDAWSLVDARSARSLSLRTPAGTLVLPETQDQRL